MLQELEKFIQNLVVTISNLDIGEYPLLTVYRHHMELTPHPSDKLHGLFEYIDMNDAELKDLFMCSGATVVDLNGSMIGLRVGDYHGKGEPIYWISCDTNLRHLAMSDQYDSVETFLTNIEEEERPLQRINLGNCGKLITWRSVQNHIVNNPRDLVLSCLNHPNRFFTPSPTLYVRMKDAKDNEVLPISEYLSESDLRSEEPIWFTVSKAVRTAIVL